MEKRLAFRCGRTLVIARAFFFGSFAAVIAFAVALFTSAPLLPTLALVAVLAAYALLFIVSPLLTDHWITRSRLILRQGWYFRAIFPFSDIETIAAADDVGPLRAPLGINRPLGQPVMFLTGSRTNLVTLRLREPRRFWQAFGLSAREIVFDVDDRTRFLAAVEERRSSFPPVQADRAHANLRD